MATEMLKNEYNSLQMENYQYDKLIHQQKDYLVSLDKEITAADSRIREKLAFPGGILKQEGKHKHLQKHSCISENKLEQATDEFDELMYRNRNYFKDGAHMLEWKGIACNIEEKMNREMTKLEERLTLFSNQRSEAEAQMLEAREHTEIDTDQFTETHMQLENQRIMDHDDKLYAFMERKLQEMTPLGDDQDSKKRKKQQQHQNRVKEVEMYKQAHSALLEVTGERDLRQIGHLYTETEQERFAHMNYINERHNKWNVLKNSTNKMKSEILLLQQENKRHDEQNKSQLKHLESELEQYSCLADSLEKKCTEVRQRTLDQQNINALLKEIMHKDTIIISDNITHFMSILEERFNNLLNQASDVEEEDNLLFANSDLLPECEADVKMEHSRTPSRSLKSA